MDLKEILTISGKPGLYKLVSNNNRGNFIVESLLDKKRFPAFARDKVSPLEEISIFTEEDEIPLREVLVKLFNYNNKSKVDTSICSDNEKLKELFTNFLPNYDRERLYLSHMKKIVSWYNELVEHNLISDDEQEKEETEENSELSANDKKSVKKNINKQNMSTLKKNIADKPLPKSNTTKRAIPNKTMTSNSKAK